MFNSKIDLSIIIPVFNENESLELLYIEIKEVVDKLERQVEIIFVDDGSTDNTTEIILNFIKENIDKKTFKLNELNKNFGKGFAVKIGMLFSIADIYFFMDADLSTPLFEINNFINYYIKNKTSKLPSIP